MLSDASNYNETKLYPILVRYFNVTKGIQVKVFNLESISQTAEISSDHLHRIMSENNLKSKVIAQTANYTNTNFGGRRSKSVNNVHEKLQDLLHKKILGIGCNARILSNAINTASCAMPTDVECPKILESFFNNEFPKYYCILSYSKQLFFTKQFKRSKVLQNISKFEEKFLPLTIKRKLSELEESNPGITEKFVKEAQNFYQICLEYIEEWSEANITGSSSFQWCFLTLPQ
ncbi:hypothetical protein J437_LFUL014238, partial [Ladona fulva]